MLRFAEHFQNTKYLLVPDHVFVSLQVIYRNSKVSLKSYNNTFSDQNNMLQRLHFLKLI